MSHLMRLAEVLRDIAEERSKSEIEQALDLCTGFVDRVSKEPADAPNAPRSRIRIPISRSFERKGGREVRFRF
jgi:hypothetical protein